MSIREAAETDLGSLLALLRGYCEFYEADPSDEELGRLAGAVIRAPEDEAFLLVAIDGEDGEVVGFALSQWKWSSLRGARVVVLDDLFVAESDRGSGHADELIKGVAEIARRHGAPVVAWLTAPDNRRAQAVYDRVGGRSEPLLEYMLELD